jgi:hypothetical protein
LLASAPSCRASANIRPTYGVSAVQTRSELTRVLSGTKGPSSTYCYDGLNNLTKLLGPDTTYDAAGNVLTKIDVRGE